MLLRPKYILSIIFVGLILFVENRNLSGIDPNEVFSNTRFNKVAAQEVDVEPVIEEAPTIPMAQEEGGLRPDKKSATAIVDSDGDGLFDEAETEIWGTDPNNVNSDGDSFSDSNEIDFGYDPLITEPYKIDKEELISKLESQLTLMEEVLEAYKYKINFFSASTTPNYNKFEHESGIFRFEYKNNLAVKMNHGLYFLEDLNSKKIAFQIFENVSEFQFNADDFHCESYKGDKVDFTGREVCFSVGSTDQPIINLELFGRKDKYLREQFAYFAARDAVDYLDGARRYGFFTRAEALKLVLTIRHPEMDFSEHSRNCFNDVTTAHPLAGYICYAKKEGIVLGIGGNFYPESNVNLFGILKILFLSFEIEDLDFDINALNARVFEQITKTHYAYPIMAKSMAEGLFENPLDKILWSNQNAFKGEVIQVTSNFLRFLEGAKRRNYSTPFAEESSVYSLYVKTPDPLYNFVETEEVDLDKKYEVETKMLETSGGTEIYIREKGNIYIHLITLKEGDIEVVTGYFKPSKLRIELKVDFADGETKVYGLKTGQTQFHFLKTAYIQNQFSETKSKLAAMGLLPNSATPPELEQIPKLKIYLSEPDFYDIYVHRTSEKRYRAYLEMTYPDGEVVKRSALIKTRGNANRGYIKSSYTIESFTDFEDNENLIGDEFMKKNDEVKLRSFIGEETYLHEKLFYDTFKKLGHLAPDFFEATVEVNGVPMGFYQVTEPIKKPFFKIRNIPTKNYYYSQNSGSKYNTNLVYYEDDDVTLSQYKVSGDPEKLLDLIHRLEANDADLIWEIDKESVFDYALLAYLTNASDSLTHNFYVYFDDSTKKWNIFPWDADACCEDIPKYSKYKFLQYAKNNKDVFNNLVYYLFNNLSNLEVDYHLENFKKKWINQIDLSALIAGYGEKYQDYFKYENELWNGKYLERKKTVYDTPLAVEQLKNKMSALSGVL